MNEKIKDRILAGFYGTIFFNLIVFGGILLFSAIQIVNFNLFLGTTMLGFVFGYFIKWAELT